MRCVGESVGTIPAIFASAREYRDDPVALERAQATFNEEALYVALVAFALDWYKRTARPAQLLDLCSATGLSALRIARAIPVASATLVDMDETALQAGADRFEGLCGVSLCQADAVAFDDGRRYDLILMNSAYHHIEDDRKVAFLLNARRMLAPDGRILVGEHFLPPYNDAKEYGTAIVAFYTSLLAELEARREPEEAVDVIRRSGLYGWEQEYEHKVSWRHFLGDVRSGKLSVERTKFAWRCRPEDKRVTVGSLAVCLYRS